MKEHLDRLAAWLTENIARHPRRQFWICLGIGLIGFGWNALSVSFDPCSDSEAFERSGSLLVAFAILMVFCNYVLTEIKENIDREDDASDGVTNASWETLTETLKEQHRDSQPNLSEEEIEKAAFNEALDYKISARVNRMINRKKREGVNADSMMLGYTEVSAGILGTLISGYGDILMDALKLPCVTC